MKNIAVFVFNGFSDWEIAYLCPEINKNEKFELQFFSLSGEDVYSMGGMKIRPNNSLQAINLSDIEMLILPGGTAWEKDENNGIIPLINSTLENGKTIAAICGATIFLGQLGFLDNCKHTSIDYYYLKQSAPNYKGDSFYTNSLAVSDKNIITANGIAPIEFAREIFSRLELFTPVNLEKWFQLYKNGIWAEIAT